ncbi:MAG: helix-turn-helix domain-containing protein [Reyranellaceae bacterium]
MDGNGILSFARTPDVERLLAHVYKWQIESTVLSRPKGINQGGTLRLPALGASSNLLNSVVRTRGSVPRGHVSLGFESGHQPGRRFAGHELQGEDVMIGYDGAELDYLTPAGFRGLTFTLPGTLVEQALELRGATADALTGFSRIVFGRIDRANFSAVRGLVDHMVEFLQSPHSDGGPQAALPFLQATIVDASAEVVAAIASRPADDRSAFRHHRRPVVRAAEEFMRANIGEPIMLHQVCQAARASERTVEYAFRDFYGMGAKKYLKLLRLNLVRDELLRPGSHDAAIQDVAWRAGFWHMGRFSVDYRRLFGERPSDTRRRSGRR